ncbi:hypothetical protein BleG1_2148 [Shouchella lehensis G1]|uniref:Uncharacterized protein n=1 Tax=Shouchella lehensis G1 TaxID=1246626 RepID=A0A060LU19_9BACI|nr:hypothetical protein BleG1_2148 [Shouchella lehensis G1]
MIHLEQLSLEIENKLQRPLMNEEKQLLEWVCTQTANQQS